MRAAILEPDARPRNEVLDGARDENLSRLRGGSDSRAGVHGDAMRLAAGELDPAGVQPGADLEAERAHGIANMAGTADGSGRPVESGEKSVTCRVDLVPPESFELPADDRVVAAEQLAPGPVAESCGVARRADDVGHRHGGEDTVGRALRPFAGQELLGLVQDRVLVADPRHVVIARQ